MRQGNMFSLGFVDPHVHIRLSFMGTYAKDNSLRKTASKAALVGGTTTLI